MKILGKKKSSPVEPSPAEMPSLSQVEPVERLQDILDMARLFLSTCLFDVLPLPS